MEERLLSLNWNLLERVSFREVGTNERVTTKRKSLFLSLSRISLDFFAQEEMRTLGVKDAEEDSSRWLSRPFRDPFYDPTI